MALCVTGARLSFALLFVLLFVGHHHHYWELDVGVMQNEMIPVLQSGVSGLDEFVPVCGWTDPSECDGHASDTSFRRPGKCPPCLWTVKQHGVPSSRHPKEKIVLAAASSHLSCRQ